MPEKYLKPMGSRYGAPMGRRSDGIDSLIVAERDSPFTLRRVAINNGGYDTGGAYWGLGQPLFWWSITQREDDNSEESSGFMRARDRNAAKAIIKELHPLARFYR